MGINGEKLEAFENGRKLMNSWIIYPTISGQKPKQTNKQKTLLTLTVSCEKRS